MKQPVGILIGIFLSIIFLLVGLLFYEYHTIEQKGRELIVLKTSYETNLTALNRILRDYNALRDRMDQMEADKEKKNETEKLATAVKNFFPEGARIVSSEDDPLDEQDNFLIINRELEYLKQETINYIH